MRGRLTIQSISALGMPRPQTESHGPKMPLFCLDLLALDRDFGVISRHVDLMLTMEHVLFGVKGKLSLLRQDVGTWFEAPRRGRHSTKPDAFYELVENARSDPYWISKSGFYPNVVRYLVAQLEPL